MNRTTRLLTFLVGFVLLLAPIAVFAQPEPFLGPIVPDANTIPGGQSCDPDAPLGFGGMMATFQNVMNFIIGIGTVFAVLIIVWAALLYIMSATNPESRSKANHMLINAVIGLIILLSAWLIVDFVMKILYSGEDGQSGKFGPWSSILTGGDACITAKGNGKPLFSGGIFTVPTTNPGAGGTGGGGASGGGGGSGANCPAAEPSGMVSIPAAATSGDAEKATPATVSNFLAMREAALKDGVDLKVTDGYRPESEQVALWNNRANIGAVARPCTLGGNGSNHNSGEALDIAVGCGNGSSNCNTKAYNWLKQNGSKWNFRNTIASDPVHWSPSGR